MTDKVITEILNQEMHNVVVLWWSTNAQQGVIVVVINVAPIQTNLQCIPMQFLTTQHLERQEVSPYGFISTHRWFSRHFQETWLTCSQVYLLLHPCSLQGGSGSGGVPRLWGVIPSWRGWLRVVWIRGLVVGRVSCLGVEHCSEDVANIFHNLFMKLWRKKNKLVKK